MFNVNWTRTCTAFGLSVAFGWAFVAPSHAQWVTPTTSGTPILATINPRTTVSPPPALCVNTGLPPYGSMLPVAQQSPTLGTAKFGGLPGSAAMPGYIPAPGVPFVARTLQWNSPPQTIGTLFDRVYCAGSGTTCNASKTYIFATRVVMNADSPPYVWNDVFRTVPSNASVSIGYYMGSSGTSVDNGLATRYLEYAGRTNTGVGQTIVRDNTKIAFRADAVANDPESCAPYWPNSPRGPWLYARMVCPNGIDTSAANTVFKTRLRSGSEGRVTLTISISGYVCKP